MDHALHHLVRKRISHFPERRYPSLIIKLCNLSQINLDARFKLLVLIHRHLMRHVSVFDLTSLTLHRPPDLGKDRVLCVGKSLCRS
jgi:hypothetical protein